MTQFQVSLFRESGDPAPFASIPITAKMPLGAMVFAMKQLHVTLARVDVTYGEEQATFYNVVLSDENVTYDREKLTNSKVHQSRDIITS